MYNSLAYVYDRFMENVPYDEWVAYIKKIWAKYECEPELVLDLACGTGEVSNRLAKDNYDVIGIDLSEDMLQVAREKSIENNLDILYLNQDMCEFELYGTVGSILCVCDGINYLETEEELLQTFKLVNNYLDPGGLFIFDLNTEVKYEELGETTFTDVQDDCAYIWENYYDREDKINEYHVTIFNEEPEGLYSRHEESHYLKVHDSKRIKELLEEAGLEVLALYDAFSFQEPHEDSQRLYYIAREVSKEEKVNV